MIRVQLIQAYDYRRGRRKLSNLKCVEVNSIFKRAIAFVVFCFYFEFARNFFDLLFHIFEPKLMYIKTWPVLCFKRVNFGKAITLTKKN